MISRYMAGVDRAVERTPSDRNRVVDAWRVLALAVVVLGHWLAASIWIQPDGTVTVMNTLEWIPYAGWFTWVVQVMPIFFFVGGYANARALDRKQANRRTWIIGRFRRLYAPAVPVIVTWTILAVILSPRLDADLVYAGVLNATIPVWFLAVYLALVAVAPFTYAWWQRSGWLSVAVLAVLAVAVDIASIRFDVPGIGWVNYVFVWGFVHQLGYAWATRDTRDRHISTGFGIAVAAGALAALVGLTTYDWYPVAMVTIPGGGPNNITPPNVAVGVLALIQIGIILATKNGVGRIAWRPKVWRWIVAVSGFMMTIYLWHLTSLSLLTALGMFTFDGIALSLEPGTAVWWVTRPVFDIVLGTATALLILLFGRFEIDVNTTYRDMSRLFVTRLRPWQLCRFSLTPE
ncbi:MAG: acyltransferase, partial [Actinomycetia bacterium]|nr:acyltransferase [Actinomycetes bacterium]